MLPAIFRTGLVVHFDDGLGSKHTVNLAHGTRPYTAEMLRQIDQSIHNINPKKITADQWDALLHAEPDTVASSLAHQSFMMLETMVSDRELALIRKTRHAVIGATSDDYDPCVFDGYSVHRAERTFRFDMANGDEYTIHVPLVEFLDHRFVDPFEILPYTVLNVRFFAQFTAEEMELARSFGNRDNVRSELTMVYNTLILGLMELLFSLRTPASSHNTDTAPEASDWEPGDPIP